MSEVLHEAEYQWNQALLGTTHKVPTLQKDFVPNFPFIRDASYINLHEKAVEWISQSIITIEVT